MSTTVAFAWHVVREYDGIEVEYPLAVEGAFEPDDPGHRRGHPDTWEAPCGGYVELHCAMLGLTDFDPHLLTKDERESILEEIRNRAESDAADGYERAMEAKVDGYLDDMADRRAYGSDY